MVMKREVNEGVRRGQKEESGKGKGI